MNYNRMEQITDDEHSSDEDDYVMYSSDDEIIDYSYLNDRAKMPIYSNAGLNFEQFCKAFIIASRGMNLSYPGKNVFFEFLKATYPNDSILQSCTLSQVIRSYRVPKVVIKKACLICQKELAKSEVCKNPNCVKKKKNALYSSYKDPKFINFNIVSQLSNIIENKWLDMIVYKGK